MLASVLKQVFPTAVHTRILDLFLHQNAESCAEQILASDPDWVGLSIYVWNRLLSREIARMLRIKKPSILLFAGGSEANSLMLNWPGSSLPSSAPFKSDCKALMIQCCEKSIGALIWRTSRPRFFISIRTVQLMDLISFMGYRETRLKVFTPAWTSHSALFPITWISFLFRTARYATP